MPVRPRPQAPTPPRSPSLGPIGEDLRKRQQERVQHHRAAQEAQAEAQRQAEREANMQPLEDWMDDPDVWVAMGDAFRQGGSTLDNVERRRWLLSELAGNLAAQRFPSVEEASQYIRERIRFIANTRNPVPRQIEPQPQNRLQLVNDPKLELILRLTYPPITRAEATLHEAFLTRATQVISTDEFRDWIKARRQGQPNENIEAYSYKDVLDYIEEHEQELVTDAEIDIAEEQQPVRVTENDVITHDIRRHIAEYERLYPVIFANMGWLDRQSIETDIRRAYENPDQNQRDEILAQLDSRLRLRNEIVILNESEDEYINRMFQVLMAEFPNTRVPAISMRDRLREAYNNPDQQAQLIQALRHLLQLEAQIEVNGTNSAAVSSPAAANEVADQTVQQILDAILAEFPDREITQELRDIALQQLVEAATPAELEEAKIRIKEIIPRHAAVKQVAAPITTQPAPGATVPLSGSTQPAPAPSTRREVDWRVTSTEAYNTEAAEMSPLTPDEIAALKPEANRFMNERISPFADQILAILEKYPNAVRLMPEYTEDMSLSDYAVHVATKYYNGPKLTDTDEIRAEILRKLEERLQQKNVTLEIQSETKEPKDYNTWYWEAIEQLREKYGEDRLKSATNINFAENWYAEIYRALGAATTIEEGEKAIREIEELIDNSIRSELQSLEGLETWKEDTIKRFENHYGRDILLSNDPFIKRGNWYTALHQALDAAQSIEEGKQNIKNFETQLILSIKIAKRRAAITEAFDRNYPQAMREQEPLMFLLQDLYKATSIEGLENEAKEVQRLLAERESVLVWLKDLHQYIEEIEMRHQYAAQNIDKQDVLNNLRKCRSIESGKSQLREYEDRLIAIEQEEDNRQIELFRNWQENILPVLIEGMSTTYALFWDEKDEANNTTHGNFVEQRLQSAQSYQDAESITEIMQAYLRAWNETYRTQFETRVAEILQELEQQFPTAIKSERNTYGELVMTENPLRSARTFSELEAKFAQAKDRLAKHETQLQENKKAASMLESTYADIDDKLRQLYPTAFANYALKTPSALQWLRQQLKDKPTMSSEELIRLADDIEQKLAREQRAYETRTELADWKATKLPDILAGFRKTFSTLVHQYEAQNGPLERSFANILSVTDAQYEVIEIEKRLESLLSRTQELPANVEMPDDKTGNALSVRRHVQGILADAARRSESEIEEARSEKTARFAEEIETLLNKYRSRGYKVTLNAQTLAKMYYEQAPEDFTKNNFLFNINKELNNRFTGQAGNERLFEPYDTVSGDNIEIEEDLPFTDTQLEYVVQNFDTILRANLRDLLSDFRQSRDAESKQNAWDALKEAVEEYKTDASAPTKSSLPEQSFQLTSEDELIADDFMSQWVNSHAELFESDAEYGPLFNAWSETTDKKERKSIFDKIHALFLGKSKNRQRKSKQIPNLETSA